MNLFTSLLKLWFKISVHLLYVNYCSIIASLLFKDKYPERLKKVTVEDSDTVAYTIGSEVFIGFPYFRKHNDTGALIHEFTHVIQNVPNYRGEIMFLVEGVADYVRDVLNIDGKSFPVKGNPYNGYQETADFLLWLRKNNLYAFRTLVTELNNGVKWNGVDEAITQYLKART